MDAAKVGQCPLCAEPVRVEATSCGHCGAALPDSRRPPAPPAPAAEGAGQVTPPAGSLGSLAVPRRSFLKDFLWVGALGWLVFGPGFSWLATRSRPYESFGETLVTVGIWSGLIFGVILGLVFAYLMRPSTRSFPIESPEAFRARLHEAVSLSPGERRVPYALRQEIGNEILLHSTSSKAGNRIQEDNLLIRISGDQVTTVGTRFAHSWLRKKMGRTSTRS